MSKFNFALSGLLSSLLAACATAPLPPAPAVPFAATAAAATSDDVAAVDASAAPSEPLPTLAPQGPAAGSSELQLWNDPDFRRQFAESYMAETEIEPRVTQGERDSMQQVLEQIAAGRMDEAADTVAGLCSDSATAVFDFTLGNIRFQQEQLPAAASAYQAAVKKYPKFRRAWKNLGLIAVRQSDFLGAAHAFCQVVELGGSDAVTYGMLGYCYANTDNHIAAESAYRLASLLAPQSLDWKLGLARSFFKQERFADAASLCGSLIQANPDRADLWLLQANAYLGMGRPRQAAENLELVRTMGQASVDSLELLADIYVNEELFDLAVVTYGRAMAMGSNAKADRALRAAKVMTARGAMAESKRLLEQIDKLQGDRLTAEARKDLLKLKARIAVAEGAGGEEVAILEQIVKLDPMDGDALILLGQYYNRTGDTEKAVFFFERAESIEAFAADASVRHAQLLVGQHKYKEALTLLHRAQALKPRDNIQQYMEQVDRVAQSR